MHVRMYVCMYDMYVLLFLILLLKGGIVKFAILLRVYS